MPPLLLAIAPNVALADVPRRILLMFCAGLPPWQDAQLPAYRLLPLRAEALAAGAGAGAGAAAGAGDAAAVVVVPESVAAAVVVPVLGAGQLLAALIRALLP